ncbi:MATE family efflux transporter [Flavonifractor sp. An135]|nr:MATE family efflux transporter [Flavonifractor sp. An135]OUQ24336.1 MATE family efflux transporter [Flavonifractor sp. An135]
MTQDLTKGKPFPTILTFSLPVIGGNLFQLFYTLADSVIVGQALGPDALAAVGSTGIILYLVLCFIQGVTGGFGICLGYQCGQRNEAGMRESIAASLWLCLLCTVCITVPCCMLARRILVWMNTPEQIFSMAYDYMFVVLLGSGAAIFYNLISNLLRALGDSRTPLIFLVFSSILNVFLDIVFIVALGMGVAGAAWATVLSQLLSAVLSSAAGARHFAVLRLRRSDLRCSRRVLLRHLKLGFPMGFQMSVMCIGQLAMQNAVNALGWSAIAGYTAATKVDQVSVLVDNAMGVSISNYVAQNHGAGQVGRIRSGVWACLLQTSVLNLVLCVGILLCRPLVVPLFVSQATADICMYSDQYLLAVAPFYLVLGVLMTYRSSIQSMGNGLAPFLACITELVLRVGATVLLGARIGYPGICLATPLAWCGASLLLVPVYFQTMRRMQREGLLHRA